MRTEELGNASVSFQSGSINLVWWFSCAGHVTPPGPSQHTVCVFKSVLLWETQLLISLFLLMKVGQYQL